MTILNGWSHGDNKSHRKDFGDACVQFHTGMDGGAWRMQRQLFAPAAGCIPFVLIALVSFAWYFVVQHHSGLHVAFTFRIISVAGMALGSIGLGLLRLGRNGAGEDTAPVKTRFRIGVRQVDADTEVYGGCLGWSE